MISFTVPAVPVAQPRQRHRVVAGHGRSFVQNYTPTKDPVNAFKASCQQAAAAAYEGAPLLGALIMDFTFVMPRPKSMMWKTKSMPRVPHIGKPDRDNLIKSVQDALEGLLFKNDSQIFSGTITKWIASGYEQPHAVIDVSEYSESTKKDARRSDQRPS